MVDSQPFENFINPEAVLDACKLLGIGPWEDSEYRGSSVFASELERKWDMKTWRAAVKKAASTARLIQREWCLACDAREARGEPRVPLDAVQFELEFRVRIKKAP